MSEIITPEIEDDQIDPAVAEDVAASPDDNKKPVEVLKQQLLDIDLYNVMLLLALLFITFSIFYLLGVLRTYSPSFPFGGFPWNASEFESFLLW